MRQPQLNREIVSCVVLVFWVAGCSGSRVGEPFGKTFYLDGAGNWGFGTTDVRVGLKRAGYQGHCEVFNWTYTLNPLFDQLNILGAKAAAKSLSERIRAYKQQHPDKEVNIIALSAGTGVAIWALERLDKQNAVDNVFLLGSSLSSGYDMVRALQAVNGKVYCYYSPRDSVLQVVRVLGTIDGKVVDRPAGMVGLRGPGAATGKIANVGWTRKWRRVGWHGAHTDCVRREFVQYEIAEKLIPFPL